ncbi:MAG: cation-translocating P-type ATPase [Chloroflexota bacterium]
MTHADGPLPIVRDPHLRGAPDVAAELGVDPARGLGAADVVRRAAAAGPNALEEHGGEPLWRMLLGALTEPFVLMLAAAGVLAVLVGEERDGFLVLLGLIPIVGADVVTEYRGERALAALRAASAPVARARRDGAVSRIAAADLVPGDIVLLQAGDVVPADVRLLRAERLQVDRSVLTGESIPEDGAVAPDAEGTALTGRRALAWAGTSVVGGRGEGVVVATGRATEIGRIAGSLATRERRRSPLQRELDRLVRILLVVAIGLVVFSAGMGFLRGHPLGENVLAGISAAIAAIPEEPPVLLAVILGLGAYRLLRRGVLVRRLNAEETLGAVDLIVTDKTGTLTQNRLVVASVRTPDGAVADPAARLRHLEDALRAEEDAWPAEGIVAGSFTRALRAAIEEAGGVTELDPAELIEGVEATGALPITRTRARRDGAEEELALGAPEIVLGWVAGNGGGGDGHDRWRTLIEDSAAAGERLVALARRADGGAWTVRALIGFADPIRPGIREAMTTARSAGIDVIVVTGDHPRTAAAIAREAGLVADRVVTGEELAGWDDARLAAELGTLHVVARSTPEQKLRLVRAARARRRIVAVTGDGVNDAPALHGADVAVAMGSGTAVAREASDLVLGDDSFATLLYGLAEGRRIVDNVQKGLVFLISTHVAFLGFILVSTIFVAERQVLLPLQILWMELFIDLTTSIAFEMEPAEPDLMKRPPRHAERPLLTNALLTRLSGAGAWTALGALLVVLTHDGGFDHAAWVAYTTLVVGQCVRAYANRSLHAPVHHLRRNTFLLAACLGAVAIQVAIPDVGPLADAFRASPLDVADWALVLAIAFAPAVLAEVIRARGQGRTTWVA